VKRTSSGQFGILPSFSITCQSLLAASLSFSVAVIAFCLTMPAAFAQQADGRISSSDGYEKESSWQRYDADAMARMLRSALDQLGITPDQMELSAEEFLDAIESQDVDPLDAYVGVARTRVPVVDVLLSKSSASIAEAGQAIDPNTATYAAVESLPKSMRMSLRTWLGRELVRARLYDEALPVIAEVDPTESIDPAAVLFYRGACYHSLLMKKEALADLRRLLENQDETPVRFTRTAKMMIADIKPLKEDSLDEISRLMTDVTRRLELGRSDEQTKDQEQKIIDKLTKLIEKIEQQQQQQQQQQGQSSGSPADGQGGQGSPMQDSQAAGGSGNGDVDRKKIDDRDGWGNLPPAERQQALQQISRDLPTHYREAIEAYFRKLATEG
jgi:tetratricopeptide (TPR) repeat protein